jgi:hypothetical protein
MSVVRIPMSDSLAEALGDAEKSVMAAKIEYANTNGLFLEEVAANFVGIKRHKGLPYLTYSIDRTKRK